MTDRILEKAYSGSRLSLEEGLALWDHPDLIALGQAAHAARCQKTDARVVTYMVDRNINYTNVCTVRCEFCAFSRDLQDADGTVLSREALDEKIAQTQALGGTQILLQGGLHPALSLDYFVDLLKYIHSRYAIHVHAFSPPEIKHFAEMSGKTFREVLEILKDAGLDSLPGGGAEILVDRVRQRISPSKCSAREWLQIMEDAHVLGMRTSATMMFGHVETRAERMEHLLRLRELQDRTQGFTAFIAWTYQAGSAGCEGAGGRPAGNARGFVEGAVLAGDVEYLRMLAIGRLFLDNFRNIQSGWLTQGKKIAQLGLFFGANDMGSVLMEEHVVRAAGVTNTLTVPEMRRIIEDAGFVPRQRDMAYHLIASTMPAEKEMETAAIV